jgi:hypothetical protein
MQLNSKCRAFTVLAFCLLMYGILAFGDVLQTNSDDTTKLPEQLKQVIGCLVSAPFVQQYELLPLGLKPGDWAWIRYQHDMALSDSDTAGEYYVVVYSIDGNRAMLLLAIPNDRGGFEAVRNGYRLIKQRTQWTADGGNGGYVVYEAMGRLVTQIAQFPRYHVQLVRGDSTCTVGE